jgi:hypothetical protein
MDTAEMSFVGLFRRAADPAGAVKPIDGDPAAR